jgi:hypothetical protein
MIEWLGFDVSSLYPAGDAVAMLREVNADETVPVAPEHHMAAGRDMRCSAARPLKVATLFVVIEMRAPWAGDSRAERLILLYE